MAGTTGIFELVAYTDLAAADVFAAVDVSDTTQSPVGSTKKITAASIFAAAQPITIAAGTVTVSTPVFQATETWNASGTTFTAIKLNVTNTASNTGSLLIDLQVGGSSKFSVDKAGLITGAAGATLVDIVTLTKAWAGPAVQITTTGDFTSTGSASIQLGDANATSQGVIGMVGSGLLRIQNKLATGSVQILANGNTAIVVKSTGVVNMGLLPTSSSGLVAGDLWNSSGVVHVV